MYRKKNGVPSVQILDFMKERSSVVNFLLGILGLTLNESSGRNFQPNYKIRALK